MLLAVNSKKLSSNKKNSKDLLGFAVILENFNALLKTNYVMEFSRICTLLSHKDTHFECQGISGCISHIWPYSAGRLGWAKQSSVYGNASRFHISMQGKVERDLQRSAIPYPIPEQSQHRRNLSYQVSVQPAPGTGLNSASSKIWLKASGVLQLNIFSLNFHNSYVCK